MGWQMNRIRKKRRINTPIKKLQSKCERLWKLACDLRDGDGCQVQKHFPNSGLVHSDTYPIDHCFTRADKNLFVEIANGTKVCSNCNWLKNLDKKSVGRLIDQIVIKREGQEKYDEMKTINLRGGESQWKNIFWLEEKIKELETYITNHQIITLDKQGFIR
jgi:hypothetical protein